jgi:hypothetical protein
MIWVTWRQHRTQAIVCLGVFCVLTIFAIAAGAGMRSAFDADGLGACLARSGGSGCPAVITSFVHRFNGPAAITETLPLFLIPGLVGVVVGAPLLGRELEQGTWQLAWSQTVPRTRWLVTKLALVIAGLVVFGAAIAAVMSWYHAPLDRVSTRLQPPPFNYEGVLLPCSLLCAFGLGVLAGLLLRNTIAGMVVAYIVWEVPSAVITLLNGPINFPPAATERITCRAGCPGAGTNSVPPVTGHLGDLVTGVVRSGDRLIVSYIPASRFWTLQLIDGGLSLVIAAAALGTAVWLLHRRTT